MYTSILVAESTEIENFHLSASCRKCRILGALHLVAPKYLFTSCILHPRILSSSARRCSFTIRTIQYNAKVLSIMRAKIWHRCSIYCLQFESKIVITETKIVMRQLNHIYHKCNSYTADCDSYTQLKPGRKQG